MKKYSLNKDLVLRRYGKLLLGYFNTDSQMRYYTIEGIAINIIEKLDSEQTEKDLVSSLSEVANEQIIQSELRKMIELSIVEVKHD